MKKHIKKFRIVILILLVISFMSFTYAWFTYGNFVNTKASVDVRSWNVEFKDEDTVVTNSIVVTTDEIYPGMDPITETIDINNYGDSSAILGIEIDEARILNIDNYVVSDVLTAEEVQDSLSHNYPFKINVSLSNNYLTERTGKSTFDVTITWPLDSGNDKLDSYWGLEAYNFIAEEENKLLNDSTYVQLKPIEISFLVVASQDIKDPDASDGDYIFGETILFDVVNNKSCTSVSSTCLKTNVIDLDNKNSDTTVTLLPDIKNNYQTGTYSNYNTSLANATSSWSVNRRSLKLEDILSVISKDISNSVIKKENMSDIVIGNLSYNDRVTTEINELIAYEGYYSYSNIKYDYLQSSSCIWLENEYDLENAFSFKQLNAEYSTITKTNKNVNCRVVPVIEATKEAISTI